MLKSLLKSIRQGLTALVLLLVLLIGVEAMLQWDAQDSPRRVSDNVSPTHQRLLVPSPTVHHDNPRVDRILLGDVQYRFDASGFRMTSAAEVMSESEFAADRIPTTTKSEPAALKIAVLGDERIFGVGLNDEDCLTSRLQWFLNSDPQANVKVINAAVPGYCPLLSLLKYRQDVKVLNPDIVILHIDYSDIADDVLFRRYLKRHSQSGAVCTHPDLKNAARQKNRLVEIANQSRLAQIAKTQLNDTEFELGQRSLSEQYSWTLTPTVSDSLSTQIRHALLPIAELANEVQGQGGVFLLSCSPTPWQIATPSSFPHFQPQVPENAWQASQNNVELLQAMASRLNVPLCNPTDQFAAFSQPARLYQDKSLELSRFGALLYARELAGFLLKQPQYQQRKSKSSDLADRSEGIFQ